MCLFIFLHAENEWGATGHSLLKSESHTLVKDGSGWRMERQQAEHHAVQQWTSA